MSPLSRRVATDAERTLGRRSVCFRKTLHFVWEVVHFPRKLAFCMGGSAQCQRHSPKHCILHGRYCINSIDMHGIASRQVLSSGFTIFHSPSSLIQVGSDYTHIHTHAHTHTHTHTYTHTLTHTHLTHTHLTHMHLT